MTTTDAPAPARVRPIAHPALRAIVGAGAAAAFGGYLYVLYDVWRASGERGYTDPFEYLGIGLLTVTALPLAALCLFHAIRGGRDAVRWCLFLLVCAAAIVAWLWFGQPAPAA